MLLRLGLAVVFLTVPLTAKGAFSGHDDAAMKADRNATLNKVIRSFPKTLNPIIYSTADEADIISDFTLFESLVAADPDTGEISCWLCQEFSYDPHDKKIVTFKLRRDATFHDGKPVTAHDVKFSFDVMVHPKVDNLNLKSGVLAAVAKVEVVDDHTVQVIFKEVAYANIYELNFAIIPRHLFPYFASKPEDFNKDQKFGRAPLGSGPYKFSKWEGDKFVEIVRNEDWWGFKSHDPRFKNAFNFRRIRFKVITNDNVAMQAFKKGEFDQITLQSYQFDEFKKTKEKLQVEALHLKPKISTSWMFIAWNARLPKFSDVKTRHALALLTDREQTLAKFSMGLRPPTNGPWGVDSPEQCPVTACPIVPFDPAKARSLLAQAGWSDSDKDGCLDRTVNKEKQVLRFAILSDDKDWSKNVLSVYTTEMRKAGVCAEIRQLDWTAMTKLVDDLNFEAFFSGFRNSLVNLPRQLWHSSNTGETGSNAWNFVDEEADKLIDQFEMEFDHEKRKALGQKLHRRIYDAHPVVWHHEGGGCFEGRSLDLLGFDVAAYRTDCTYWPRWYKTKK